MSQEMRLETEAEHLARDMREGRFPEQSERQMVPVAPTMTASDEAKKALEGVTPGPWEHDGEPWNLIVWNDSGNRVCFMAHSNGLDDDRDMATARFIAWAREGVPALLAEIAAKDAEIARRREALQDAGAMRDAACRVSEWFCTEARHLEGPRINALRMAIVAYDRHMQPDAGDTHE